MPLLKSRIALKSKANTVFYCNSKGECRYIENLILGRGFLLKITVLPSNAEFADFHHIARFIEQFIEI